MNKESLKGILDLLLLAVVGAGAAYGYLIARRLAETSGGALDLPEGTLYPALHRLESKKLLSSSWATVALRRRRLYDLTPAGEEVLLMRVVLKGGALLALFGLALGLAASLFFAELISGMLHDVAPTDLTTLGLVALTLILVALLASAVPAWRASEVDPVQALRKE